MLRELRWLLIMILALAFPGTPAVQAEPAVVRAVVFYSPSCPHCHQVITEDLPPLFEKYGDQLQIAGIDTTSAGGQALYEAAIQRFNIPPERMGVPTLIVGDVVLVGSLEIPQQFPGLIKKYL
ncbi:MAG: vitamin K epoxide reductase, partial [Chloroflexi bacterium]|nr:vitamin K epoxide reductase [Chloroflexota bacterium]